MPEPVIGRVGLRTFLVSRDGYLMPTIMGTSEVLRHAWSDGTCVAECQRPGSDHRPPSAGCTCGIYSMDSLSELRRQYPEAFGVVAVVALEGRVLEGALGTRAEAARVIALWLDEDAVGADTVRQLAENYLDVPVWNDVDEMVAAHVPGHHPAADGASRGRWSRAWETLAENCLEIARITTRIVLAMLIAVVGWLSPESENAIDRGSRMVATAARAVVTFPLVPIALAALFLGALGVGRRWHKAAGPRLAFNLAALWFCVCLTTVIGFGRSETVAWASVLTIGGYYLARLLVVEPAAALFGWWDVRPAAGGRGVRGPLAVRSSHRGVRVVRNVVLRPQPASRLGARHSTAP